MKINTLAAATITGFVALSLVALDARAAKNGDQYFINIFGQKVSFAVAAKQTDINAELNKAISKAVKFKDCRTVSAAINPGSTSIAIVNVAIRTVHKGVNPRVTRHTSTGFSARWVYKGELHRVCISLGGKGHAKAMGLYEKPFKYTANFDLSEPVITSLYFN